MESTVSKNETLYRAVKRSRPDTFKNNRPTSALFKDDNGVSVDRDGQRETKVIISAFKDHFDRRLKGLVSVGAEVCLANEMAVIPSPSESNSYHAEIFNDTDRSPISMKNALILARKSEVVYMDSEVKWN